MAENEVYDLVIAGGGGRLRGGLGRGPMRGNEAGGASL